MKKILIQIGVRCESDKNEMKIFGLTQLKETSATIKVPNLGDHRICMSSFVLAVLTGAKAKIKNFETVYTSAPSFLKIMRTLGAKFELQK